MCVSSASTGLCGGQRATAVPTATESREVKVLLPSVARFRRLAYPTWRKVTTSTVLGSKRHGCPTAQVVAVGAIWVASKPGGLNSRNDCSPEIEPM